MAGSTFAGSFWLRGGTVDSTAAVSLPLGVTALWVCSEASLATLCMVRTAEFEVLLDSTECCATGTEELTGEALDVEFDASTATAAAAGSETVCAAANDRGEAKGTLDGTLCVVAC
jgi:hypothetical protein